MGSARELRSRVTSIRNTQKVTRAMQMVSAVKMQRAVKSVLDIRPYAHNAWSVLMNMARAMNQKNHPLLEPREVSRVLVVIIASNRGLCGGFNTQILKTFRSLISEESRLFSSSTESKKKDDNGTDRTVDVLAIGKKAERMAVFYGKNLVASFPDLMHTPSFDEARMVANMIIDWYKEGKYDKVTVLYTDYISAVKQEVKIRQILPVSVSEFEKQLAEMDILQEEVGLSAPIHEYKIEPSPDVVLDTVLPALIRTQMYHMVLESNASKEASRMVAMKNATDAAGEIADQFMLVYNRIRQAKITQEIAEISAGRAALE